MRRRHVASVVALVAACAGATPPVVESPVEARGMSLGSPVAAPLATSAPSTSLVKAGPANARCATGDTDAADGGGARDGDGVGGDIAREPIMQTVRQRTKELHSCYDVGVARDPALKGRVVIHFTIAASGRVSRSDVAETNLPDPEVVECVRCVFLGLTFPSSAAKVRIAYPIEFAPE